MDSHVIVAFRFPGADLQRLPEIPGELAGWLAQRTPEDLERMREDVEELDRLGLTAPCE